MNYLQLDNWYKIHYFKTFTFEKYRDLETQDKRHSTQGLWKWQHSIEHIWLPRSVTYNWQMQKLKHFV